MLGVPVGFFTSVYLAKIASPKVRGVIETAVSLLAGIPSVVYGLVGMLILVPGIRKLFNVPDGASLLAAIIVLAIMILPSIIKVSLNALEAVPKEYEDASLALGATDIETYFKVSVPAARSGIAAAVVLGVGRAIGEAMAVMMVSGNVPNMPSLFQSVRFLTTAVASEMSYSAGLQRQALFSIALVLFLFQEKQDGRYYPSQAAFYAINPLDDTLFSFSADETLTSFDGKSVNTLKKAIEKKLKEFGKVEEDYVYWCGAVGKEYRSQALTDWLNGD